MLPFDFDYYQPASLKEAVDLYQTIKRQGQQPMFILGGTELITLGRIDLVLTDAVIDLKGIAECNKLEFSGDYLVMGSSLTLTQIEEANPFPLLSKVASEVADHTARGKITVGGNICGQIFYREAVLPFLLTDSQVVTAGAEGVRVLPINEIFNQQLLLRNGEFLIQIATEKRLLTAPFFAYKRRQQWYTGYPLITLAAIKLNNQLRVAISGLCPFPFRSSKMENALNEQGVSLVERIKNALQVLPEPILEDVEGSAKYRLFVLENLLLDCLTSLEYQRS